MKTYTRLCDLHPRQSAVICLMEADGAPVKRMKDMGVAVGEKITCLFRSPFADPSAYRVNDITVALRKTDCENVWVDEGQNGGLHD